MTNHHPWSPHPEHSPWKLLSSLWHRYQVFRHYQGCNHGSGTFHHPVLSLPRSKWSIFSITAPFQPLSNPPSCATALYARSTADITSWCSLQIWKASDINLPPQISPDVWIITTPPSTPASTMKLICPERDIEIIIIWKPVHILKLPMAIIKLLLTT